MIRKLALTCLLLSVNTAIALEECVDSLYTFRAELNNIVDGDTMDVTLDKGLGVTLFTRVRILDLDTPEIRRPASDLERAHGRRASVHAATLLSEPFLVKLNPRRERDSFGRALVSLTLKDCVDFAQAMRNAGYQKRKFYE